MRAVSLALACLACAAHGRRIHTTSGQKQGVSNDESNPLASLAKTLQAFNTPTAAGGQQHSPVRAVPQRVPAPLLQEETVEKPMSRAIPFLKAPKYLDGTLPGDQGFDPIGISTNLINTGGSMKSLKYCREAEIMHGRQAMLACVGMIWPSVFGKLPVEWADKVSFNPFFAADELPPEVTAQLFFFMVAAEVQRGRIIWNEDREWGDHGFDPLDFQGKFCKTPEELFTMKEKELANGRLAMIAFVGMAIQLELKGEIPPFV